MKRAILHSTWIVLLHFMINILHGIAHSQLHIALNSRDRLFVLVVMLISPFLALVALLSRQLRLGLVLLALSMACSFGFGIYKHYVLPSPDRIGEQLAGLWGHLFAITALLLAITECFGTYVGVHFLRLHYRRPPVTELPDL